MNADSFPDKDRHNISVSSWHPVSLGLFFTPIPTSFGLQPITGESQNVNISLDPQHREATLLVEQPYTATDAQGITKTLIWQQTYIYRRGEQRWLLSPRPFTILIGQPTAEGWAASAYKAVGDVIEAIDVAATWPGFANKLPELAGQQKARPGAGLHFDAARTCNC